MITINDKNVNELLDSQKTYGGISEIEVGSKFTIPSAADLGRAIKVRETTSFYESEDQLKAEVESPKARRGYTKNADGSWERTVQYLVVETPEGDLAFGTLASAAAYSGQTEEFKSAIASSVNKDCRGRGRQILAWLEAHPGVHHVTFRKKERIVTRQGWGFDQTVTCLAAGEPTSAPAPARRGKKK